MNYRKVYLPLKKIGKEWGCECFFRKVSHIEGGSNIAAYFTVEAGRKIIKVVYTEEVGILSMYHIFFHELGHHLFRLLRMFDVKSTPPEKEERAAERFSYFFFKNYFPKICPHHASFSLYKFGMIDEEDTLATISVIDKYL